MTKRISGLAHCCHHSSHWEYCYDFDERVKYIKDNKPQDEQELRLRLFQIIPDEDLPGKNSIEWETCVKAQKAYDKAREAYLKEYSKELNALHDKLFPDCTWNGRSIFKEK